MRRFLIPLVPLVFALATVLLLTFSAFATTWSDPFAVADSAKRPAVAIDANGEMHIVWANSQRSIIEYRHCAASDACDAIEKLPRLNGSAKNPALAVDTQNRPMVVWEQQKAKKHTIYFSRREAGVWSTPLALSNQPKSVLPALAIGDDDISQVVYESIQKNGRGIYYVTTTGAIPRPPMLLDLETADAQKLTNGRNVRIAVDGSNQAHVVWNTLSRPYSVKYAYQVGGVFGSPKIVADAAQDQTPDIAIDRHTNRVGIIWETRRNNRAALILLENGAEVFRKKNVEGGFDTVRRPRLAADCGGRFQIAFQREKSAQSDWNIYYRQFDPATLTFTKTTQLTQSQKDDAMPALAANRFVLLAYITGSGGKLNALRGDIDGVCYGEPTPTPTFTPWEHIPNTDASIVYSKEWKTLDNSKASDGNFARCGASTGCKKGSSAKMEFVGGSRIEWETAYANAYGKVDVLLDGKAFERVDLCSLNKKSSKPKFSKRTYILSGDAGTPHSIEIKWVGATNCTATNKAYFAVDGFNILR